MEPEAAEEPGSPAVVAAELGVEVDPVPKAMSAVEIKTAAPLRLARLLVAMVKKVVMAKKPTESVASVASPA